MRGIARLKCRMLRYKTSQVLLHTTGYQFISALIALLIRGWRDRSNDNSHHGNLYSVWSRHNHHAYIWHAAGYWLQQQL